jgi:hypothetical protein
MSNRYHSNLVEAVGSSFYYYTHHKDLNLSLASAEDIKRLTSGWLDKYQGNWGAYNNSIPMTCNTFKPCVDQLVYRILTATEDEIERRVGERVNEYIAKLESKEQ